MKKDFKKYKSYQEVFEYCEKIRTGKKIACKSLKLAVDRFYKDLENKEYDFEPRDAEYVIRIIEKTFCHQQGEALDGTPMRGKPFLLLDWLLFVTLPAPNPSQILQIKRRYSINYSDV